MNVFVTGGTGFLGRALIEVLAARGDRVTLLTRHPAKGNLPAARVIVGDPSLAGDWQEHLSGCDAVVNLAGEPIFGRRWSHARKQTLEQSRIKATANIVAALARARPSPRVLVNGSAIGFYGDRGDDALDESAAAGRDFLARLCQRWESEAQRAEHLVRVVRLRTGIVLASHGGALLQMVRPFKLHLGGHIGSGRKWLSFIHRDDWLGIVLLALDTDVSGALNITAPTPVRMKEFAHAIGDVLGRSSWAHAPEFAIRLAFGEMADMLLTGQRVLPRVAEQAGYQFRYPDVAAALRASLPAP